MYFGKDQIPSHQEKKEFETTVSESINNAYKKELVSTLTGTFRQHLTIKYDPYHNHIRKKEKKKERIQCPRYKENKCI